mmetsp:Transcript_9376/g.10550  ORF Transcript_9376/g.10550 Transcript_9376/m.10550 type:complete len:163 (+) Transcript_9376:36-524(+)
MNSINDLPNSTDLKILFDALKFDPKAEFIEKSVLTALFLYTDADKVDPLFYSYVKKKLDSKQDKISFEEFQKLFDISQSNFTRLSHEELTYYFEIFDPKRKGKIDADSFINAYRATADFRKLKENMSEEQIIKELERDFDIINEFKQIDPQEFFNILNDAGR